MTRGEAIRELKIFNGTTRIRLPANFWEALNMAIKALEQEPCEDAISRQAVKELYYKNGYIDFRKICELPPVTPQPKMGHWIAQDIYNCHTDFKCSECGYIHNFMHIFGEPIADYTYCPNCGAKMIEPQESEGKE